LQITTLQIGGECFSSWEPAAATAASPRSAASAFYPGAAVRLKYSTQHDGSFVDSKRLVGFVPQIKNLPGLLLHRMPMMGSTDP